MQAAFTPKIWGQRLPVRSTIRASLFRQDPFVRIGTMALQFVTTSNIDHPTIRCSDRHQRQTARERRKRAEGLGRVCAPARQGGHCRVAAVGELQVARRYAADLLAVRAYCFRALSRTVRTSRPTRQVDERWSCPDAGVRGTRLRWRGAPLTRLPCRWNLANPGRPVRRTTFGSHRAISRNSGSAISASAWMTM